MGNLRLWIQGIAAFMNNVSLLFLFTRNIYQGRLKSICVPGLNCYSCPTATGTCPLGSIQRILSTVRPSFASGHYHIGLYVLGTLGSSAALWGVCPAHGFALSG